MDDKIIKEYSWYDFSTAIEESGKSLAELFDFKTGLLIWRDAKDEPNEPLEPTRKAGRLS